jgi:branched-chain amino acid transport system permease protein
MVVAAVVAILVERLVVRRVAGRDIRSAVSVTIALMLAVNGAIRWLWQNRSRGYRSPFPNAPEDFVSVAGARLRYTTVGIWLTLLVVVALLALVLRSTKAGLAFRAVSSSPENAALMGVRSGRVLSGAWGLAAAIGALAGCMLASRLILDPNMMLRLIVYSFAAATIGGLSSAGGALLGGLIVGVGQSLLGGYVGFVGSNLTITAMVVLMVALLVLRPAGLFGSRRVSRF